MDRVQLGGKRATSCQDISEGTPLLQFGGFGFSAVELQLRLVLVLPQQNAKGKRQISEGCRLQAM